MKCYESVKDEEGAPGTDRVGIWKPFLRQALVASCCWSPYFSLGLLIGCPTVAVPQMRREGIAVSEEVLSWLSSTFAYSTIPWVLLLPKLAGIFGRKKTMCFVSISSIVTFIVFCLSSSPLHLLVTEMLIGIQNGSALTTSIIVLAEYTAPAYRGIFLTIKSASIFWGIWVANAIGTFTHWTYIPKFGLICSLYTLTVFLWPESPYWLAGRRKFVEARNAHRWLKGVEENSEFELEQLIASNANKTEDFSLRQVITREFYMPLFISLVLVAQYHFSGKFVITVYAIDIIKRIVDDEPSAYKCMLILDGVTVLSAYIGSFLSKMLKRRTLLLAASGTAVTFLFILSLYLYLIRINVFSENVYFSVCLLVGYSVSISCGPVILWSTLYAELIPSRFKNICIVIIAISFFSIHGTLLKVAPLIFKVLTMPGLFAFYALSSLVCFVFIYFYLPETKDKTLLASEGYFKKLPS